MFIRIFPKAAAVFTSAALVGAMTLIWLVFGDFWRSLTAAAFLDWFAANGATVGRVMFSFAGIAALSLAISIWIDRADRRARARWAGSLLCLAGVLVITFVVEVPLNKAFETHAVAAENVRAAIDEWMFWHVARILFGSLAAILAIAALVRRAPTLSSPPQAGAATHIHPLARC